MILETHAKGKNVFIRDVSSLDVHEHLKDQILIVSERCIRCELCQKECAFLRKYGKPKDVADSYDPNDTLSRNIAFECSLCQLCSAVCPVRINPASMFLEMRRESVKRGVGDLPEHSVISDYERRGTSQRYSYYALPRGCTDVFFPGCTLTGTRPLRVKEIFSHLEKSIPNLGIVLDCCSKPSHDLGRADYFQAMFGEMRSFLLANGIRRVIVACPNCYKVFKLYGGELAVQSVYELLARSGLPQPKDERGTVTIHDSCAVRFEESIHRAVREIVASQGLTVEEMPHHSRKTLCCGEGGSVGFVNRDLARNWGHLRKNEAGDKRIVTYCAGCAGCLGSLTPTSHLLDLFFEPTRTLAGNVAVSKAPLTYVNRLRIKRYFKRRVPAVVTRERTFRPDEATRKGGLLTRILLITVIIAAILLIHYTGATRYLEQEELKVLIRSQGALAPLMYMLFYTVAPALFLPGLPITIVGGILFGPFWGVVYTITSATAGACVAFLISRYIARGWIERKLTSPRWRRLDEGVEKHGWKIVAFTRLIPLFPFNLLNYAFGLTKIPFLHYAVATFVCMLPACIAFIVFSSSLLDLIRGRVSSRFLIGSVLVAFVSLIPLIYNRYLKKRDETPRL